jgi:hypothetical protein
MTYWYYAKQQLYMVIALASGTIIGSNLIACYLGKLSTLPYPKEIILSFTLSYVFFGALIRYLSQDGK